MVGGASCLVAFSAPAAEGLCAGDALSAAAAEGRGLAAAASAAGREGRAGGVWAAAGCGRGGCFGRRRTAAAFLRVSRLRLFLDLGGRGSIAGRAAAGGALRLTAGRDGSGRGAGLAGSAALTGGGLILGAAGVFPPAVDCFRRAGGGPCRLMVTAFGGPGGGEKKWTQRLPSKKTSPWMASARMNAVSNRFTADFPGRPAG